MKPPSSGVRWFASHQNFANNFRHLADGFPSVMDRRWRVFHKWKIFPTYQLKDISQLNPDRSAMYFMSETSHGFNPWTIFSHFGAETPEKGGKQTIWVCLKIVHHFVVFNGHFGGISTFQININQPKFIHFTGELRILDGQITLTPQNCQFHPISTFLSCQIQFLTTIEANRSRRQCPQLPPGPEGTWPSAALHLQRWAGERGWIAPDTGHASRWVSSGLFHGVLIIRDLRYEFDGFGCVWWLIFKQI